MTTWIFRTAAMVVILGIGAVAQAQYFSPEFSDLQRKYDLRHYYGYPYHYSYGPRYDPYWSYTTSTYPALYDGDGSYYGMGYSGYAGDGWYGSYYYW